MSESVKVPKIPDCQFSHTTDDKVPAEYDGKTAHGPWAYMCHYHFVLYGTGLGTGRGQLLIKGES